VSTKAKDQKKEIKTTANGNGVTRRTMMKVGAAAGAATVVTSKKALSQITFPTPPAEVPNCTFATGVAEQSPPTQPFVNSLPIPPIAIPTILSPAPTLNADTANGEAVRAAHQDWLQFFPFVQYDFQLQGGLHNFDPVGGGLVSSANPTGQTYIWGYNGIYPGPTILNVYGVPIVVRFHNNLPVPNIGFGDNNSTTHLHNGHTASESDGFAGDFWPPGLFKDHHYPNVYAGFNEFPPIGDPLEAQYTYWYHDHRHSFTATNNYRGLNGIYLLYNELDNGLGIPGLGNLGLPGPYGLFDIPLFLTDKLFCTNGQLFGTTPDAAEKGGVGDKFVVNGVIQPYFNVYTRKYRFRIYNTGPTRIFLLNLVNNNGVTVPFQVVATHGNLLQNPVTIPNAEDTAISEEAGVGGGPGLNVFVSERFDVIFDFTDATPGTSWYLTNNAAMFVNNSAEPVANGTVPAGNVVMAFNITGPAPGGDPSVVPETLIQYPNITTPLANLFGTRVWNFNFDVVGNQGDSPTGAGVGVYNSPFTPLNSPASGIGAGDAAINTATTKVFNVNGLIFDSLRSDAQIHQGSAETWLIRNRFPGTGWVHPVHIHLEEGRVLDRRNYVQSAGGTVTITNHFVSPLWSGRRDVYPIAPNDEVLIFLQFRDWFGKYMIHCHNLDHEDDTMIARWDVVSGPSSTSTSAFNDQNTPNTSNFTQPNTGSNGTITQPNSGAQPVISPALQTLSNGFNLNPPDTRLNPPNLRGSRKGVKA
jgi:FtsP/CotA-like multicopper oxidase with cupredoxin domain